MGWPIIRGKSCVGETAKSMKPVELAVAQEDNWRKIALTLIDPATGVLNAIACQQQLRHKMTR